MSRSGDAGYWRMDVLRSGTGMVPLKIAVRGRDVVELQIGQTAPAVLSTRQLAEFVEDLRAAGRMLRGLEAAQSLVAEFGRPSPLSPDELDAVLDDASGSGAGNGPIAPVDQTGTFPNRRPR